MLNEIKYINKSKFNLQKFAFIFYNLIIECLTQKILE